MAKLEQQPRLTSVASDVIEWARRVTNLVNPNSDTLANVAAAVGPIRTPATTIVETLDGPAFLAYAGTTTAATVNATTMVGAPMNTKGFDTANCFDTTTGRWKPTVAGIYQINVSISLNALTSQIQNVVLYLGLNGSVYSGLAQDYLPSSSQLQQWQRSGSVLVSMNGTTDYVQAGYYVNPIAGAVNLVGGSPASTYISGFLARRA